MRYTATVLAVSDVRAARAFYEDLFGLTLAADYGKNITFTCGLSLQESFGWLVGVEDAAIARRPNNMELAFETRDLDGFLARLKAYPAARQLGAVVRHSWGQRVVRFYDPDGHLIEVGEDMQLVTQRFLDQGLSVAETAKRMDVTPEEVRRLTNP